MGDNGEHGELFQKLNHLAGAEVRRLAQQLPPELRPRVESVPVFFEMEPNVADVADGIEPDTLGLFDEGGTEIPLPRIRLWLANIWDFSDKDEEIFLKEVGATYLHEVGHFFGWDEEDLERRDLD